MSYADRCTSADSDGSECRVLHAGYLVEDMRTVCDVLHDVLHAVLDEAERLKLQNKNVAGDYHTEFRLGHRGIFLDEFACMGRVEVAHHDKCWTFCSSLGV